VSGIVVADYDKGEIPEILTPTVRTSRGAHFYFSTSEALRIEHHDQGELRGLGGYVVAPPSVHPSGHVYEWILHPDDVPPVPFEEVRDLIGITKSGSRSAPSANRRSRNLRPSPAAYLPEVTLTRRQREYMELHPTKNERDDLGFKEVEFGIMSLMASRGYTDPEILAWFLHHEPPKFLERGKTWLLDSITNARSLYEADKQDDPGSDFFSSSSSYLNSETGCISEEPERDVENPRPPGWQTRRWTVLMHLPEGLRVSEAVEWIAEEHSINRTQVSEDLRWLRESGWLDYRVDPDDGRVRRVYRSARAEGLLAVRHPWKVPYSFFIGLGRPTVATERDPDELLDEIEEKEVENRPTRQADDPLAALGAEERRRERSLINDTFRIHIGGRPTYIQLLTPPEEWRTALFHEQLRVGLDADGLVVRRSFISPRDDALLGEDAPDPLSERVLADGGYRASNRVFAWAVQLEETPSGFEVTQHRDGESDLPSVGLIVQAYRNFFAPIERLAVPTGVILKTRRQKTHTRQGEKKTVYSHEIVGEALPVSFDLPALDDFLTDMFEAQDDPVFLESLPDGWKLVKKLPWQEETPLSKRVRVPVAG
jgi:hypothetical protein